MPPHLNIICCGDQPLKVLCRLEFAHLRVLLSRSLAVLSSSFPVNRLDYEVFRLVEFLNNIEDV